MSKDNLLPEETRRKLVNLENYQLGVSSLNNHIFKTPLAQQIKKFIIGLSKVRVLPLGFVDGTLCPLLKRFLTPFFLS